MTEQHFQGQYAIIPAEVLYDQNLTMADKILYGVISNLCNQRGYCWATNAYLGEVIQQKKDTVSKSIGRLKNNGYLADFYELVDGKQERRLKVCTSFKIPGWDKNPTLVQKSYPGSDKNPTGDRIFMPSHLYENKIETKTLNKGAKKEEPKVEVWPTFEDFWNAGLPKVDKERAQKYWSKLKQQDKEFILDYIPKYVESTDDKRYLKTAATFLNQKAWQNEIIDRRTAANIASGASGITINGTIERLSKYTD